MKLTIFGEIILNCLAVIEAFFADMEDKPGRFGSNEGQVEEMVAAKFRVAAK
jgi:hypothetical protein